MSFQGRPGQRRLIRGHSPDAAPKQRWYVATLQMLFIIALIAGLCVALVLLVNMVFSGH